MAASTPDVHAVLEVLGDGGTTEMATRVRDWLTNQPAPAPVRGFHVDDLVDQDDVAQLIGLTNRRGVSVYRARYDDFPEPVIEKGKAVLWVRQDVLAWPGPPNRE